MGFLVGVFAAPLHVRLLVLVLALRSAVPIVVIVVLRVVLLLLFLVVEIDSNYETIRELEETD